MTEPVSQNPEVTDIVDPALSDENSAEDPEDAKYVRLLVELEAADKLGRNTPEHMRIWRELFDEEFWEAVRELRESDSVHAKAM